MFSNAKKSATRQIDANLLVLASLPVAVIYRLPS